MIIYRQLLTVDNNLYYNQNHLKNILNGTQNHYMQNISDSHPMDSFSLDVLKRKEWVRQNKEKAMLNTNCKNRVDMIGSGNVYDSSKIETMIARENFLKSKFNQDYSKKKSVTEMSENKSRNSEINNSQVSRHSNYSRNSQAERKSQIDRKSQYRESMEQGWPARNSDVSSQSQRRRSNGVVRDSMNAKEHNDRLFMKKNAKRKSMGYTNISRGKILILT